MKHIPSIQSIKYSNSKSCIAHEYPLGDRDINAVIVELKGRYPETGRTANTLCKELIYVINGTGSVVVEGKKVFLQFGDVVLIEPGEKFYWEGNLTMFMPCTPAWTPEQHKFVP
ncbi:cupin domain-containing protein [Candidatus Gottesmanbacteria bacterium]|nr:cupin domain-containing protein [Candidatus Gottesmanbacteria bacterium]